MLRIRLFILDKRLRLRRFIGRFRRRWVVLELQKQLESEKQSRIYYQSKVYAACRMLEWHVGVRTIVVGTKSHPCDEFEKTLSDLLNHYREIRLEVSRDLDSRDKLKELSYRVKQNGSDCLERLGDVIGRINYMMKAATFEVVKDNSQGADES